MSKQEKPILEKLSELYEDEHGDCDQNSCDMSIAYRMGYFRWAICQYSGCGAASDRFIELYEQLPKIFHKHAEKERKLLCKEEHIECECGSIIWLPEEVDYYCDSCCNYMKTKKQLFNDDFNTKVETILKS